MEPIRAPLRAFYDLQNQRQFLDAWLVPFADQLASVLDFGGFLVHREFTCKNARVLFLPQIQKV